MKMSTVEAGAITQTFPPDAMERVKERLDAAVREGRLSGTGGKLPDRVPVAVNRGKKQVSDTVSEMREPTTDGLVCGTCLAPYPGHAEDCPTQRFTPAEGMRALHPDTVTLREELADLKRRVAALEERR